MRLLDRAVSLHQSGMWESAVDLYRKFLSKHPKNADAKFFLGTLYLQMGHFEQAIPLLIAASNSKQKQHDPLVWLNLGLALQELKQYQKAEAAYKKALELDGDLVEVHNNIGTLFLVTERLQEAKSSFETALNIKHDHYEAIENLIEVYSRLQNFPKAKEMMDRALQLMPANGKNELQIRLAENLWKADQKEEARKVLDEALARQPNEPQALRLSLLIYWESGAIEQVIETAQTLLKLGQHEVDALIYLSQAYNDQGYYAEALVAAQNARESGLDYDLSRTLSSRALRNAHCIYDAKSFLEDDGKSHLFQIEFARGALYDELNSLDQAEIAYRKALTIQPNDADTQFNLATVLLKSGRLADGMHYYESREKTSNRKHSEHSKSYYELPLWQGESIAGKGVLVHGEQGVGDIIHFLRFIHEAEKAQGALVFSVSDDILQLLAADPRAQASKIQHIECVYRAPIMSLPLLLSIDLNHIPNDPYLFAPEKAISKWKNELGDDDTFKVGLVWAGNPKHSNDQNRSCRLADYAPLSDLAGIRFYALQKGGAAERQSYCPPKDMNFTPLGQDIKNFVDTAGIIANLDLIITVDTSVAHLAGAMGRPVWLLLPFTPEWRWQLNRHDSPWYPSMRIFRQPIPGDWKTVTMNVKEALTKLVPQDKKNLLSLEKAPFSDYYAVLEKGERFFDAGNFSEALIVYRQALERLPKAGELHFQAGRAAQRLGILSDAVAHYQYALEWDPYYPQAHNNLGRALQDIGKHQDALKHFQIAVRRSPNYWLAYANLGWLLISAFQEHEAAVPFLRQALSLNAEYGPAYANMAIALHRLWRLEAGFYFEQALARLPDNLSVLRPYASFLLCRDELSQAEELLNKVLALDPNLADAHVLLATIALKRQDWEKAWQEWPWRKLRENDPTARNNPYLGPMWKGEELQNALLIYAEQGLGDQICFARFLSKLHTKNIIWEVWSGLGRLFKHNFPGVTVIEYPHFNSVLHQYDAQISIMDLPVILNINNNTLAPDAYLTPPPEVLNKWQAKEIPHGLRVGLCWSASNNDALRSSTFDQFSVFSKLENIVLVSLQKGEAAKELTNHEAAPVVIDYTNEIEDFADTAALLHHLDLIITVDTAVAHLAAAMGKPTWVLMPLYCRDWRWPVEGAHSLWYTSMHLWRHQQNETWEQLLVRVAEALKQKTKDGTWPTLTQ